MVYDVEKCKNVCEIYVVDQYQFRYIGESYYLYEVVDGIMQWNVEQQVFKEIIKEGDQLVYQEFQCIDVKEYQYK